MSRKIGVLGSAFDPPTLGHLDVVQQVAGQLDQLLLVPCAAHAFNKKMTPFAQRVAMLQRLVDEVALPLPVEVCTLEQQLFAQAPESPVYTYDLLEQLEHRYANQAEAVELIFIRGPDNADPATWARFYRSAEIEQRWGLLTADERVAIRSSVVRQLCAEHQDCEITLRQALANYLSPQVIDYIIRQRLYQAAVEIL